MDGGAQALTIFFIFSPGMADATEQRKKRTFRKFSYRGIDLDQLLDLSSEQVSETPRERRGALFFSFSLSLSLSVSLFIPPSSRWQREMAVMP